MLPDATLRGMRMYRSHGGTVPDVCIRNLSSEASSPGSDAPCRERRAGRGADTPAISRFRVGTVATGTAPAFGRTLAPRYGSDLLTLRLRLALQWGGRGLSRRPRLRSVDGLCQSRSLPAAISPLRARSAVSVPGLSAGWSRQEKQPRSGLRSSNQTLWVTASIRGPKRPADLTRLARGF
jgi:hypothetical protein